MAEVVWIAKRRKAGITTPTERANFASTQGAGVEIQYHAGRARRDAGHDLLWISVKQPGRKKAARMVSVLGYTKSAKMGFLKEKSR